VALVVGCREVDERDDLDRHLRLGLPAPGRALLPARPSLDKQRLGGLIDLIGTIGLGDEASRSKDILGRVYEYFLGRFASAEGFMTPLGRQGRRKGTTNLSCKTLGSHRGLEQVLLPLNGG
jgi:hypothetical protein